MIVANANSDTVSVIDVNKDEVVETIALQPAPAKAGGGSQEMVKDLKAAVFPDREIKMMVVKDGARDVRVV